MNEKFDEARKHFPLTKKYAYFACSSTGLIPDYVYEGVKKYQDDRFLIGGDSDWNGVGTLAMIEDTKTKIGEMINCKSSDITFGLNSSHMFTLFSRGLSLEPGDNVIIMEDAFISGKFTWQVREPEGLEVRYAKTTNGVVEAEDIFKLVDQRTRVVSLDYVESSTGFRKDLEKIGTYCAQKNIYLAVDAVHGLGVLPIDVQKMHIDFLVGNDYKWMCNYCGTGFAYINPKLRDIIQQWGAGWMSDSERFNTAKKHLILRDDAGRYELGYPNAPGIFGLGLVAKHYLELGKKDIEEYVLSLADYLYEEIEKIPGASVWKKFPSKNRSSIVVVTISKDLKVTDEKLKQQGIFAYVAPGNNYGSDFVMKLSIHYFNNRNDIKLLADAIRKCAGML